MKKIILAMAAVAMSGGMASAQDAVYNWSGFYLGLQGGGAFGTDDLGCEDSPEAYDANPISPDRPVGGSQQAPYDYSGVVDDFSCEEFWSDSETDDDKFFGAHVGYDWLLNNGFVLGVRLDGNVGGPERGAEFMFDPDYLVGSSEPYPGLPIGVISLNDPTDPGYNQEDNEPGAPAQWHGRYDSLDWFGTARGRIGFVPTPGGRLMIFGSGGVAFGEGYSYSESQLYYTPDEADRVFDTASGPDSNDGEYFPGTETYSLPSSCVNGPGFTPEGGSLQTGVICSASSGSDESYFGFTIGAGAEFRLSEHWSVTGEYSYINLGSVDFDGLFGADDSSQRLDFHTVMIGVSLRQ